LIPATAFGRNVPNNLEWMSLSTLRFGLKNTGLMSFDDAEQTDNIFNLLIIVTGIGLIFIFI
jgi:hypothetical protein